MLRGCSNDIAACRVHVLRVVVTILLLVGCMC